MKFLSIVVTIFVGLVSTKIYAGEYDFKPGLWETTTLTEIEGISEKMPPEIEQECMKGTDFMYESDDECKYEKKRVNANKMLVDVICTSPEGMISKGTGETNFNGKTSSGSFDMEMSRGSSGSMKIKSSFSGKYLGACK